MKQSKEFRQLYEFVWTRMFGEYLNSRNVKSNVLQRANLKLPYAWTIVETFTPQIIEAFTQNTPYINAIARKTFDPDLAHQLSQAAECITDHYSYQMDQMRFFQDFGVFVKNMLIYGTAIAKIGWQKKEKMLPARQKTLENGVVTMKNIEQPVTLYEGPVFFNIDIIDFFPDWGATRPADIQAMRGCVHRVYRTMEELRSLEKKKDKITGEETGLYDNLDEVDNDIESNGYNAWSEQTTNTGLDYSQTYRAYNVNQYPGQKQKGKIEIWEYWGQYEESKGVFKEKVITIANGRTCIRNDLNPYDYALKPFLASVDQAVPGEFYGQGELEPIYSLFREATALRNARLDQTNQAVNRMLLIDRNSGINVRNLYSRTSGIVLTNDINGMKMMDVPEVPGSSYRELQQIDYEIQNASAMINASQGTSNLGQAFGNTAKGIGFLQGTMTSRMGLKIKNIEYFVMREFGQRLLILNRQFLSPEMWQQIHGNEPNPFEMFSAEDFYQSWDFKSLGAIDRLNKEQRQAQFQQSILPFLQFSEKAQPGSVNMKGVAKTFMKDFDIRDPYMLFNTPEDQQQISQKNMQQQMAAQQHEHDQKIQTLTAVEVIKGQQKMERDQMVQASKIKNTVVKGLFDLGKTGIKGYADHGKQELKGIMDLGKEHLKGVHNQTTEHVKGMHNAARESFRPGPGNT